MPIGLVTNGTSRTIISALIIFETISTFFLFHLSTYTPAIDPKRIAGIVKERTTIDTAVLEWVSLKTMRIDKKLKRFTEICVKTSPIQR
jgi:hypothetical protein